MTRNIKSLDNFWLLFKWPIFCSRLNVMPGPQMFDENNDKLHTA